VLATDWFMVIFRLIHILGGVLWVGSVFLLVVFVQPSAAAIAPAGAPFMAELLGKRRLVDRIIGLGTVTVLAGLLLYFGDADDYPSFGDWLGTSFGVVLTVGALCAIAALTVGIVGTRPAVTRMLAVGREVAESGGPPSPEQAAELAAIQARAKILARTSLALLIVAVAAMSSARYW
jgi:hypothetical protein